MSRIAFIKNNLEYLPEVEVYKNYFLNKGCDVSVVEHPSDRLNADVYWFFMGVEYRKKVPGIHIHEYASLATPPFGLLKDRIKKIINIIPDGRIYLNETIKTKTLLDDVVPYIYRDMGVGDFFYKKDHLVKKEYDFVYIGSLSAKRNIRTLLSSFSTKYSQYTLLIIGEYPDEIYHDFKGFSNIIFSGRVSYDEIPDLACKAKCGINYIPNIYPYKYQTSTKLLEYLAMGLNVCSTRTQWVKSFSLKNNIENIQFFNEDLNDFRPENYLSTSKYWDGIENYTWNKIVEKADLLGFMQSIIKNLSQKKLSERKSNRQFLR
ncbi:hypothetical protein CKY10_14155 [Photorhabdus sp. HUG-39]|uniref:Glycosyltransferase n=1 Tax=Photorhabdus kayaii TaxID=230088 RepID=A0ABX0B0H1_9GAMM|nr:MULTISPECIES: glycosyltransferase [Photorhabdus]MCC8375636.1 glycosyltransferase [Photorhabdus bodei]NDL12819.1 glycosyltransferase [Photorhabdus kayaii]NDL26597.1 glycosyltransferase [Photorhabdus kayaii]RAX08795.1 hypothetical protein CKY10_14155 [Photorhabdus sp. HUG-39]